jgi:hypothetical protein
MTLQPSALTLPSGVGEPRGVLDLIDLFPVWGDCYSKGAGKLFRPVQAFF